MPSRGESDPSASNLQVPWARRGRSLVLQSLLSGCHCHHDARIITHFTPETFVFVLEYSTLLRPGLLISSSARISGMELAGVQFPKAIRHSNGMPAEVLFHC